MKLLIAAGGTGGHIYPAVSIAEEFREKGNEVVFAGRENSFEKKVYEDYGYKTVLIRSSQFDVNIFSLFDFSKNLLLGVRDAFRILKTEKPDAILGGGGYVSAPVLLAASVLRTPYFLYEQNIIPGRTNRIFGKGAKLIFTGFPDVYNFFKKDKTVFSGNPVRKILFEMSKASGLQYFGFTNQIPVLLVFGGSGGATAINNVFSNIIDRLLDKVDVQIIFITGNRDFESISERQKPNKFVKILPYLNRMEYALAAADFAVSRAGAMTLTELSLTGTPGIVVPFPFARDNHQLKNALFLKNKGCIELITQDGLTENLLINKLVYYLSDISIINKMKCENVFPRDSAEIIYKNIMEIVNG